ncbi:MAG: hypothetical protein VYC34_12730, partial [Planctomycetota bacterium]|nr:hypothetical protein [Planctomycetota bacterium]
LAAAAASFTAVALAGCYEKVTRAEGFGANYYETEPRSNTDGPVSKALFGSSDPQRTDSSPGSKKKAGRPRTP